MFSLLFPVQELQEDWWWCRLLLMARNRHPVERVLDHAQLLDSQAQWRRWWWGEQPLHLTRFGVVGEEREWLAHSYGSLLSAHSARLAWGHKKYSNFFIHLRFKLLIKPQVLKRYTWKWHLLLSLGDQLLLCILYFTRPCQGNVEKQYLYQGKQFRVGGFFALSNKTLSFGLPLKEDFRLSHRRK